MPRQPLAPTVQKVPPLFLPAVAFELTHQLLLVTDSQQVAVLGLSGPVAAGHEELLLGT